MSEDIVLADPDPDWPRAFDIAQAEIAAILPEPPLLIAHIGSTAVPGLPAKPVIDIIALVADMEPAKAAMPGLEALGYQFRPAVSSAERMFLRRYGANGVRSHHLHIHTSADEVQRHVLFRDLLRADPHLRDAYLALKRDLARRHGGDRQAYAMGKDSFIDAAVLAANGPARAPFWND